MYDFILLMGRKRVGKNTTGDRIQERIGYKTYGMARPIKDALKELFLFTEEQVDGSLKEEPDQRWNGLVPRTAMKTIYNDYVQSLGLSVTFFAKHMLLKHPEKKLIITDCRSPMVAEYLKIGHKCYVIKIERDSVEKDNHISETECEDYKGYDVLIKNNGTIEELYAQIDSLHLNV